MGVDCRGGRDNHHGSGVAGSKVEPIAGFGRYGASTQEAPSVSTPAAATRETKLNAETVPTGETAEEIFLSPRVIDRAAFESYAERLRALIDELGAESAALRGTIEEARATHKGLTDLGAKNKDHLELSAKLLKTLTQKSAAVEEMLAKAHDIAGAAGRFEQEADRIVGAKLSLLEKRIAESLDSFERRLHTQAEVRAKESSDALEEFRAAREQIKKQVDQNVVGSVTALREACERAEALVGVRADGAGRTPTAGSLGDLVRRATEAAEKAQTAARAFEEIESRAGDGVRRLSDSLDGSIEFTDRIVAQRKEAELAAERAVTKAREAEQSLSERATEAARVFKPINEARKLAEETSERLRALVNQAETLQTSSGTMADEVRGLVERAESVVTAIEPWRGVLLDPARDGSLPEPIQQLIESIRAEMAVDLSKMAAAMTLIAGRAAAASAQVRTIARGGEAEVIVRSVKPEPAKTAKV